MNAIAEKTLPVTATMNKITNAPNDGNLARWKRAARVERAGRLEWAGRAGCMAS